ncbi:hypothetical protein ACLB2K_030673 [Fragaria x ananassa]
MANAFLFFFLLILSSNIILENIHACIQSERRSLLSFALTLSSPQLNWTSSDCCDWEGITCKQDGWITHLQLPSKGLKLKQGIFRSSSLGNLTHLTHLNLSHNSISGSLDQSTGFFLSLNHLEILDLSYNLLSGELPSSFFEHAWNLTSFNVRNNNFSGCIPSSTCVHDYSPSIRLLDFSYNTFSGNIPHGLAECSKLQVFRAGYNNLSGLLPVEMYNATTLEEISLPANSLSGVLSEGMLQLVNLTILDLSYNQLSGMLPHHIGIFSKLKLLVLDFNSLEGTLPPSLTNCMNLVELRLANNFFGGEISRINFSNFIQLSKLDLRKNNFTGPFPISLYSCKSLKAIRLSYNYLEGEIQPEILSLKSLSFLSLGNNTLTNVTGAMKILMRSTSLVFLSLTTSFVGEELPADLGIVQDFDGFQNLRLLDLSYCELTGQIPLWLSKLKKLQMLNLYSNRLSGSIPTWLGTLPMLFNIGLESNLLSGEFPKELYGLPALVSTQTPAQVDDIDLELAIYGYKGATLVQYKLSYFPPAIYIGNNTINGNIPTEIGQLQLLHILSLSNNTFSGNIPENMSNLKNLEILDLSMNHLSGKIPPSLASLNFLSSFNVSYNNLEGQIPASTQLQSFNASAFEGNPKICGAPLSNECLPNPKKGNEEDNNNHGFLDIMGQQIPWLSVVLGFTVGFLGVCVMITVRMQQRLGS